MNQIIQLCQQRAAIQVLKPGYQQLLLSHNSQQQGNQFVQKCMNERSQEETEFEEEIVKKVNIQLQSEHSQSTNCTAEPILKQQLYRCRCENTPPMHSKLESSELDDEMSFCLDDIFAQNDLSNISENGTNCEKWQEESIDSIIYIQKPKEMEMEEQKESHFIQILSHIIEPPIVRIPEQIKPIIVQNQYKLITVVPLKIQCSQNHQWETSIESFLKDSKCPTCHLENTMKSHGRCLLNPLWLGSQKCKDCKAKAKQDTKRQRTENLRRTYEKYEKEQNDLYVQATRAIGSQQSNFDKLRIIKAFRETEVEVEKAATQHAIKFCNKMDKTDDSLRIPLISGLYKILMLPERALEQYVRAQQKLILKQEYKQYARLVHPDKNRHPQAGLAFKKLKKYWYEIPKSMIQA